MENWAVSLDGHSKAPREVHCRLHGTPGILLVLPYFSGPPPDRHEVKALDQQGVRMGPVYIYVCQVFVMTMSDEG